MLHFLIRKARITFPLHLGCQKAQRQTGCLIITMLTAMAGLCAYFFGSGVLVLIRVCSQAHVHVHTQTHTSCGHTCTCVHLCGGQSLTSGVTPLESSFCLLGSLTGPEFTH